ncbi:MAG: SsrA-binding protein [Marinilabiliales bacterium]|nr:MAG: SsrA-binding protein [Marinilabiliales bacterium]
MSKQGIEIKNKKASFLFELSDVFTAGVQLTGTEIKSIRQGKANFTDAYCIFKNSELFIKGLHISEYSHGNLNNHDPKRERKLLLTRRELTKLEGKTKEKGYSIVPTKLFISENGYAKIEIALAKGKRQKDKREDIKKKDIKRDLDRQMNY